MILHNHSSSMQRLRGRITHSYLFKLQETEASNLNKTIQGCRVHIVLPPSLQTSRKFWMERMFYCITTQWSSHCTGKKNPTLNHAVPVALIILLTQDETTEKNHKVSVSLQLHSVFVFFTFQFVCFFRLLGYQETIFSRNYETRGHLP